ncbi:MAG: putative LPS assembly protein LptD [Bacteroidia bacterium]
MLLGCWLPPQVAWAQVQDSLAADSLLRPVVLPAATDSLRMTGGLIVGDSLAPGDSLRGMALGRDSIDPVASAAAARRQRYVDSLKAGSDLQAQVIYQAADSIVFDVEAGTLYLYREADLKYQEITLKARQVRVDMNDQTLFAEGRDSSGTYVDRPVFSQGEEAYNARTVAYNFKTQKGRVTDGRFIQEGNYVIADTAKYMPDGSFYGRNGKFTTCDAEHPHFYIQSRRLKVLPDSRIISGPLNLVVGDFPIPIVLPFGFVPKMAQNQKSTGLLMPQYGDAQDRGFFLRGLGYYFAINDYLDLKLDGDIYTRGGWRLAAATNYRIRYRFSGSFSFSYGVTTFNEPLDPDYSRIGAWSLQWNHQQPIDPTARLSSSVNISSSNKFQRQISYNQNDFFTNNLNSSITFSKKFNNLPFSFGLSARHQQDLNKETVSMNLPEFTFNMARQTPFKNVDAPYLNWLKQLGLNYDIQASNRVNTMPDSLFLPVLLRPRDTLEVWQVIGGDSSLVRRTGASFYTNGLQHRTSLSTTAKLLNNINLSPSFNYNEFWYLETVRKFWNSETRRVEEVEVPGFARGYNFQGGVSASTNFYGIYQLTRSRRQVAFRQRFTPSLSYNLKPDFAAESFGFYRWVQSNDQGDSVLYSIFEDGIYGGPTRGESQSMSFSLGSVIEMKYRKKESFEPDFDKKEDKFVRTNLLDNLSLNTAYNFAADSFQLAPFNLQARTSLLNKKINLNASATVDPYSFGYDPVAVPYAGRSARRLNTFMWVKEGKIGRLTRAQVSLSTSFSSKELGKRQRGDNIDQDLYREAVDNYFQYVDFDIPWSVRLRYNLSYNKPGLDAANITQTVNIDGDFNFTDQWKISFATGYDMVRREFVQTSVNVHRDLHCFQMSFRWIPFGPQRSYSLVISAKAPTLNMMRLTKNDFWQDRFTGL